MHAWFCFETYCENKYVGRRWTKHRISTKAWRLLAVAAWLYTFGEWWPNVFGSVRVRQHLPLPDEAMLSLSPIWSGTAAPSLSVGNMVGMHLTHRSPRREQAKSQKRQAAQARRTSPFVSVWLRIEFRLLAFRQSAALAHIAAILVQDCLENASTVKMQIANQKKGWNRRLLFRNKYFHAVQFS